MKKAKIIKKVEKKEKNEVNELYSIKSLFVIVLIILLVFMVFYSITMLVVKPSKKSDLSNNITEVDSKKITLNNLLNRSEKEYYALATKKSLYNGVNSKVNYFEIYERYITDYSNNEDSLKFYLVDLDDALNKNYIGEKSNIKDSLDGLKLSNETLFKIKNGKIESYYEGSESIINILSNL